MTYLIEYKMVKKRALIFVFDFKHTKFHSTTTTTLPYHYLSLDKWLSIENWHTIYEKLDNFTSTYVNTEEINTDQTVSIENSHISITASWAKVNSSIRYLLSLRSDETHNHYVNVKLKSVSKLENLIKNLKDEIKCLKNQQNPIVEKMKNNCSNSNEHKTIVDASEKMKLQNNRTGSLLDVDKHEEYVPEKSSDSSMEILNVTYEPMSGNMMKKENDEYLPQSTITENNFDVYHPNSSRKIVNFHHEQYTPDSIQLLGSSQEPEFDYKPIGKYQENQKIDKDPSYSPSKDNNTHTKNKKRLRKATEVELNAEDHSLIKNVSKKNKLNDSDDLFGDYSNGSGCDKIIKNVENQIDCELAAEKNQRFCSATRKQSQQQKTPTKKSQQEKTPTIKNSDWLQKTLKKKPSSKNLDSREMQLKNKKSEKYKSCNVQPQQKQCKRLTPSKWALINEQQELKMNELQEKIKQPDLDLPNVEILTLKEVPTSEIISTYSNYREKFNDIIKQYHQRTTMKFKPIPDITSLLSGELLTSEQQLAIMAFLEKKFQVNGDCSGLTDLFWDTILPDWSLLVFMAKYQFTRKEAIERIRLQEKIASSNDSQIF